jgi:hypothetical protein
VNTAPKLNGLHHNLEFECESENKRKIAHTTGIPIWYYNWRIKSDTTYKTQLEKAVLNTE